MSSTLPLIVEDCERGGKVYDDEDEEGIENDFAYRNNVMQASKSIRMGFIRKVYGLLSVQLLLTVVIASICLFTPQIKTFIHTNNWLVMVAFFATLGLLVALHIKRRDSPANLILLAAFTVVQSYTIGVVLTFYSQAIILQALILTLVVVGGLTFYTLQTKHDFSTMHSSLFAGLCILIVGGFMQIFLQSTIFEIVISLAGAFIFCLFIIFDTQMLMQTLSPEEYILATINLYLDIVNLFLYILRILQALNK